MHSTTVQNDSRGLKLQIFVFIYLVFHSCRIRSKEKVPDPQYGFLDYIYSNLLKTIFKFLPILREGTVQKHHPVFGGKIHFFFPQGMLIVEDMLILGAVFP